MSEGDHLGMSDSRNLVLEHQSILYTSRAQKVHQPVVWKNLSIILCVNALIRKCFWFSLSIRNKWVKLEKSYRKLPTIGLSFLSGRVLLHHRRNLYNLPLRTIKLDKKINLFKSSKRIKEEYFLDFFQPWKPASDY